MDDNPGLSMGPGGRPVTRYVLYGLLLARWASVVPALPRRCAMKLTVVSNCSGIALARRFSITRATFGRSVAALASASTMLATVSTRCALSGVTPSVLSSSRHLDTIVCSCRTAVVSARNGYVDGNRYPSTLPLAWAGRPSKSGFFNAAVYSARGRPVAAESLLMISEVHMPSRMVTCPAVRLPRFSNMARAASALILECMAYVPGWMEPDRGLPAAAFSKAPADLTTPAFARAAAMVRLESPSFTAIETAP